MTTLKLNITSIFDEAKLKVPTILTNINSPMQQGDQNNHIQRIKQLYNSINSMSWGMNSKSLKKINTEIVDLFTEKLNNLDDNNNANQIRINEKISAFETALTELNEKFENIVSKNEEEIKNLKIELKDEFNKNALNIIDYNNDTIHYNDLSDKLNELTVNMNANNVKIAEQIKDSNDKIASLEKNNNDLNSKVDELTLKINKMLETNNEENNKITEVITDLSLEKSHDMYIKFIDLQQSNINNLVESITKLTTSLLQSSQGQIHNQPTQTETATIDKISSLLTNLLNNLPKDTSSDAKFNEINQNLTKINQNLSQKADYAAIQYINKNIQSLSVNVDNNFNLIKEQIKREFTENITPLKEEIAQNNTEIKTITSNISEQLKTFLVKVDSKNEGLIKEYQNIVNEKNEETNKLIKATTEKLTSIQNSITILTQTTNEINKTVETINTSVIDLSASSLILLRDVSNIEYKLNTLTLTTNNNPIIQGIKTEFSNLQTNINNVITNATTAAQQAATVITQQTTPTKELNHYIINPLSFPLSPNLITTMNMTDPEYSAYINNNISNKKIHNNTNQSDFIEKIVTNGFNKDNHFNYVFVTDLANNNLVSIISF